MAGSASTGNSGTGSTGNGNGGSGNGNGSTGNSGATGNGSTGTGSTSNSGPAAPGSQTSSNGSFSTGNGNGNGNGNSGKGKGPSGVSIGNLGVKGTGPNGEKGTWAHTVSPDSNGNLTVTPGPDGKHTVHATFFADPPSSSGSKPEPAKPEPVMTVDEVYGKNNQAIVENQGDYEASSNEKSNVETSTFGKQDEISVTPVSVTKDEGLVNNEAIQSVEGLNFQQKDKANQEVTEAKKSRDEAEAEDNADGMRDQLKSVAEKDAEEDDSAFQVGDRDEDVAAAEEQLNALKQEKEKAGKEYLANIKEAEKEMADAELELSNMKEKETESREALADLELQAEEMRNSNFLAKALLNLDPKFRDFKSEIPEMAKAYGIDIDIPENMDVDSFADTISELTSAIKNNIESKVAEAENRFEASKQKVDGIRNAHYLNIENLNERLSEAQETYDSLVNETFVGKEAPAAEVEAEEAPTVTEEAPTVETEAEAEEAASKEKAALDEAKKTYDDLKSQVDGKLAELNEASDKYSMAKKDYNVAYRAVEDLTVKMNEMYEDGTFGDYIPSTFDLDDGTEISTYTYRGKDPSIKAVVDARNKAITELSKAINQKAAAKSQYDAVEADYNQYVNRCNAAKTNLDKATEAYNNAFVGAPTTEAPAYKGIIKGIKDEINNSKELTDEQKAEAIGVVDSVQAAADKMNKAANELAANPNDINAVQKYLEETGKYLKTLEDAKGDKTLKNTDLNKTFTRAVAAANNFDVTYADGTQKNYSEFAAEMAVKSPELAKGLYEAKAKNYEENGHKVLAAIETAKSKMVMTWLGSKFTFADNQIRSQFIQMAKTDMRATYATYNNVLNDPNATPEQKAEAFKATQQANVLMTAATALKASTGFFSGIGDSMSDGVYGTTDPGSLNGYQEALNVAGNLAKIALGLGVTPGANEAYQNMYYMAGAKVNESGLFSKDFDGDGFALCQEYGNNAAVGMIAGAGELAAGVALMFNPATSQLGINLAIDSVQTFFDGLYGVQKEVNKSIKYSNEVLSYLNEAKSIVAETGNKEATGTIDNAIKQVEDFQLKSDEVGNLDNWLEGSGSNTADNGKFNQALSYDEWLKLIEADPVMQEYAKSLNR